MLSVLLPAMPSVPLRPAMPAAALLCAVLLGSVPVPCKTLSPVGVDVPAPPQPPPPTTATEAPPAAADAVAVALSVVDAQFLPEEHAALVTGWAVLRWNTTFPDTLAAVRGLRRAGRSQVRTQLGGAPGRPAVWFPDVWLLNRLQQKEEPLLEPASWATLIASGDGEHVEALAASHFTARVRCGAIVSDYYYRTMSQQCDLHLGSMTTATDVMDLVPVHDRVNLEMYTASSKFSPSGSLEASLRVTNSTMIRRHNYRAGWQHPFAVITARLILQYDN